MNDHTGRLSGSGLSRSTLLVALEREGEAFLAAARRDFTATVPSCPGWDVARLTSHLGRVHRWAAGMVSNRVTDRPEKLPPWPGPEVDIAQWYAEGLASVLDVLRTADPDAPVWNWSLSSPTTGFWVRRMAHETAMHRWDAQSAQGHTEPIEPVLAVDGVDEMFDMTLPSLQAKGPLDGLAGTLHLHATDGDPPDAGEWLVTLVPDHVEVRHVHDKGDVAVRGSATDLLLFLWGRRGYDELETFGRTELLDAWAEAVRP